METKWKSMIMRMDVSGAIIEYLHVTFPLQKTVACIDVCVRYRGMKNLCLLSQKVKLFNCISVSSRQRDGIVSHVEVQRMYPMSFELHKPVEKSLHYTNLYHDFGLEWERRSQNSQNKLSFQLVIDLFSRGFNSFGLEDI